jgi:hypothetical protein
MEGKGEIWDCRVGRRGRVSGIAIGTEFGIAFGGLRWVPKVSGMAVATSFVSATASAPAAASADKALYTSWYHASRQS